MNGDAGLVRWRRPKCVTFLTGGTFGGTIIWLVYESPVFSRLPGVHVNSSRSAKDRFKDFQKSPGTTRKAPPCGAFFACLIGASSAFQPLHMPGSARVAAA
jgi:hypothetical protein